MFREPSTTDVIIEIIRSLPEKERVVIAESIKEKKGVKKNSAKQTDKKAKYVPMDELLQKYKGKLPKGYKFDREEAYSR